MKKNLCTITHFFVYTIKDFLLASFHEQTVFLITNFIVINVVLVVKAQTFFRHVREGVL